MRVRLREAVPDTGAFYADRYPQGYDHRVWPDHVERVNATVGFAMATAPGIVHGRVQSIADLSCGDGRIPTRLANLSGASGLVLGDINFSRSVALSDSPAPADTDLYWLPVQESLRLIEPVDLYVCSETLEHLDNPDAFLEEVRTKTKYLLVTTPEAETSLDNPEHYWGWDSDAVGAMLAAAGFTTVHGHQVFTPLSADVYKFQMWMVS
jgi:2-polyprenyl-3-methyl-5-hydroxy-6-metoxy-1,4-benzoquinol methylase